jgi:hypothetical protein
VSRAATPGDGADAKDLANMPADPSHLVAGDAQLFGPGEDPLLVLEGLPVQSDAQPERVG